MAYQSPQEQTGEQAITALVGFTAAFENQLSAGFDTALPHRPNPERLVNQRNHPSGINCQ